MIMAFVNMHSAGLEDPGHPSPGQRRRYRGLPRPPPRPISTCSEIASLDELKAAWAANSDRSIIGAAIGDKLYQLEDRTARGALDVRILHEGLLGKALGISEEAVRDEKHLRYIRGIDAAVEEVRKGAAQIAFLLKPTSVQQVADTSFNGGVMPQKSTDFYPKLLSGMVMYKLD